MNTTSLEDLNNYMNPEELRREIFENILKHRIFLADRIEKIEKALVNLQLIPKDSHYCSPQMLEVFNSQIMADDEKQL